MILLRIEGDDAMQSLNNDQPGVDAGFERVFDAKDETEASLVQEYLASSGIRAEIQQDLDRNGFQIVVPVEDAVDARRIIAEVRATDRQDAADKMSVPFQGADNTGKNAPFGFIQDDPFPWGMVAIIVLCAGIIYFVVMKS